MSVLCILVHTLATEKQINNPPDCDASSAMRGLFSWVRVGEITESTGVAWIKFGVPNVSAPQGRGWGVLPAHRTRIVGCRSLIEDGVVDHQIHVLAASIASSRGRQVE